MMYGVSKSRIRKLPEKMISINFLSINVDYVSIFIQGSGACSFFRRETLCVRVRVFVCVRAREREREREKKKKGEGESCKRKQSARQPWRCTIYVI